MRRPWVILLGNVTWSLREESPSGIACQERWVALDGAWRYDLPIHLRTAPFPIMRERAWPARIVPFYSYKGGAGTSMALANVAWTLANHALRVLVIDWVWAHARGVTLRLIDPGKPTQNDYIESFNGRFRGECLNEHWFASEVQAQAVIETWRRDSTRIGRRRGPTRVACARRLTAAANATNVTSGL